MLEKEVIKVLEYKINVFQELKSLGITTTTAKRTGLFSQNVMKKFKNSDTSITLDNLNRLCAVLEMPPRDIIKYVETEEDREKYLLKMK